MGPFVLPQAWRSGIRSFEGGGRTSMRSSCSIGWRSRWGRCRSLRVPMRLSQPCEGCVFAFAFTTPNIFYSRYHSKKGQEAHPWVTPAQAIPGGDRPEAAAGRGAHAHGPPRAAGPPAGAPGAARHSRQDFFQGQRAGGPRAVGAAGRRDGHCAAPARDACPGVPPRGHPQRQATRPAPPVLAQVVNGVPAGHRLLDVEQALPA